MATNLLSYILFSNKYILFSNLLFCNGVSSILIPVQMQNLTVYLFTDFTSSALPQFAALWQATLSEFSWHKIPVLKQFCLFFFLMKILMNVENVSS